MPGAPDPLYVAARSVLLDALDALKEHLDAIVLVGAQAVYLHTTDADLAVAPYTTDGDLALNPRELGDQPLLEELLHAGEFQGMASQVGRWVKPALVSGTDVDVIVDLLVPESLGGGGRRAARIPPHAIETARKVRGLEGALVDQDIRTIRSLNEEDTRSFDLAVAGPSALLVAKTFKIAERESSPDRQVDKDALDMVRILRAVETEELIRRFFELQKHELSREVTRTALAELPRLFGSPGDPGCQMAVRAAAPLEPAEVLAASAATLTNDLLDGLGVL